MDEVSEHEARFAANMAAVRRAQRMSQEKLATQVGLGRPAIAAIETGNRRINLGEALDIAQVLGVTLKDLLSAHLTIHVAVSPSGVD